MLSRSVRLLNHETAQRYFQSISLIFLSISGFFAYQLLVYATKPSPLLNLNVFEVLKVSIQLVLVASIFAITSAAALLIIEKLFGRFGHWPGNFIKIFCIAVAIAIGIENFIYTVFGSGMKSSNFIVLKILIVYLSLRVAIDIFKKIGNNKTFTKFYFGLFIIGLAISAAISLLISDTSTYGHALLKTIERKPNIIIISADGINAEQMGVYGYKRQTTPFISAKANEFAVFSHAYTNNANTTGSVTSMLTGMSPIKTGVIYPPDIMRGAESTRGLPQILGTAGYTRTNWSVSYYSNSHAQNMVDAFDSDNGSNIFSTLTSILPESYELSRWLITAIVKEFIEMIHGAFLFQEMENPFNLVSNHDSFIQDARNLAGAMRDMDSAKPFFINTHFMMTHGAFFPIKKPYFSKGKEQNAPWMPDFYDDAIRDFDTTVKIIYERLQQLGKLDNTIIIITSDHGSQWSKLKRVPLLIRFPEGAHSGAYEKNAQRLDIAPTVLAYLGLPKAPWMEGDSLLQADIPANRSIFAYGILKKVGVSHNQHGHMGHTADFDNHSITLIQCNNAFTIDSPDLVKIRTLTSAKTLAKYVNVAPVRDSQACEEREKWGVGKAATEILKKLNKS